MFHEDHVNRCICCSVKDCKHHNGDENYCTLDSIRVASHEKNPTDESCVDCRSFECRQSGALR